MVVIEKPWGDLIPYERNAKIHSEEQIDQLAESIRQFGFRNPILIDRNNVIMAGHGRLAAAKQAGLDTVPCICYDDMTADEVRKYRLIDNKTAESPWDYSLLTVELEGLDFEGFDLDWGTDNAMPEFEDFDGDGDGGGSYITNGDKVRIVIGALMFDIEDPTHELYAKTKEADVESAKARVSLLLSNGGLL